MYKGKEDGGPNQKRTSIILVMALLLKCVSPNVPIGSTSILKNNFEYAST